jgi:hypothetical protein
MENKVTPNSTPKKARFLKAYTITCQITKAAAMAGIDKGTHYDWLRKDPEYKAQFEAAQVQAADMLEDEAIRRAYIGVEKPVTVAGKREVIHEYSDTLLIFLLKGARPNKYRDSYRAEVSGPNGTALVPTRVEIVCVPPPKHPEHLE